MKSQHGVSSGCGRGLLESVIAGEARQSTSRPEGWVERSDPISHQYSACGDGFRFRSTHRLPVTLPRRCEREAIHFTACGTWIASRSLSSGGHSPDPLARNDGEVVTRHAAVIPRALRADVNKLATDDYDDQSFVYSAKRHQPHAPRPTPAARHGIIEIRPT